jgi:hypothetical protein
MKFGSLFKKIGKVVIAGAGAVAASSAPALLPAVPYAGQIAAVGSILWALFSRPPQESNTAADAKPKQE